MDQTTKIMFLINKAMKAYTYILKPILSSLDNLL